MTFMHRTGLAGESRAINRDCSNLASSNVMQRGRFEMLYQKYVYRLFHYCVRLVGRRDIAEDIASDRRDIAEDIASEVFLTLYQNLDRIQDRPLSPWLFTVARNKALDYWRHEAVAYALRLLRQSFGGASRERDGSSLARCSSARAESMAARHHIAGGTQPTLHAISFRSPARATQNKRGVV